MVSGFSQGGILSYELAARHDGLFAAAFPIAGKLPNAEGLIAGPEGPVTRVHAFHGEADDRIPFADGESAVAALQGAGWAVEMTSVAGVGHSINAEMREALYAAVISALPL
jgi:phospholipase/carboxylesterase